MCISDSLSLSHSLFLSSRPEGEACKQKWEKKKEKFFFFFFFFPSLSSGPSFFLLIFSPSPSLQTRTEKSLVSSFLPFYLLGWWKSLDQKWTGLWCIYPGVCKWGRDPSTPTKWWGRKGKGFYFYFLFRGRRDKTQGALVKQKVSRKGQQKNLEESNKRRKMKISWKEAKAKSRSQFIWYSIHFFNRVRTPPFFFFSPVRSSIQLIDCHGGPFFFFSFTLNHNTICIPLVGGQCGWDGEENWYVE